MIEAHRVFWLTVWLAWLLLTEVIWSLIELKLYIFQDLLYYRGFFWEGLDKNRKGKGKRKKGKKWGSTPSLLLLHSTKGAMNNYLNDCIEAFPLNYVIEQKSRKWFKAFRNTLGRQWSQFWVTYKTKVIIWVKTEEQTWVYKTLARV